MVKSTNRSKRKLPNKAEQEPAVFLRYSILIPLALVLVWSIWHYRAGIKYYIKAKFDTNKSVDSHSRERDKHDARNIFLMTAHQDKIFGIDVSQYQGIIAWDEVELINESFAVDFVFIRATMGATAKDSRFEKNWEGAKSKNKLRGAYHYFRPNENSLKQARNFINTVDLKPGDLPPVLDIEERPRSQPMDSLRVGLKRWLDEVERHYGVRPIVYSGDSYFTDFLEKEFKDYTLWIANYNFFVENPKDHWDFWQFSEKGAVSGIKGYVDLNMYQRDIESLESLALPQK